MTAEDKRPGEGKDDEAVAEELAKEIEAKFNRGDNYLISIKVFINTMYRRANIFVGYGDMTRLRESGSEDTTAGLCEALVEWPDADPSENNEASWEDLSYPETQMRRAFLLSEELKTRLIILPFSDDLKCDIKNGKVHIDRV